MPEQPPLRAHIRAALAAHGQTGGPQVDTLIEVVLEALQARGQAPPLPSPPGSGEVRGADPLPGVVGALAHVRPLRDDGSGNGDQGLAAGQNWQERAEYAEEALDKILDWVDAYPADVFPEPDMASIRAKIGDRDFSALHGTWARHLLSGIGEIARVGRPGKHQHE